MDYFASEFDRVFSELQISKPCISFLPKRIVDLDQSSLDNAQYLKTETNEISPVPLELSKTELERLVCRALFLTGNDVNLGKLEARHRLKKNDNVIIKFKSRNKKYEFINHRKNEE